MKFISPILQFSHLRRYLLPGLSLLVLTMCTDQGNPVVEPTPEFILSADSVNFGAVQIGDSRLQFVEIRNPGSADLTGDLMLQQSGNVFSIQHGATYLVPAHDTLRFGLLYTPDAERTDTARVSITTNDVNHPEAAIILTGSGSPLPEPGYTLVPQTVDFGTVLVGQSAQRRLKIHSVGTADLTLDSLEISENTVTAGNVSFPLTLVPGDSTEVNLSWAPGATGFLSATLTFYAGTSGITAIPVNLTGEAQQPVSFSNDIQPIFNSACVSCHGGSGGLFLTAGNAYGNLVNVTSSGYAPAVRVKPGDTANSVLYGKIFNTGQFGQKMPPDSDLSTAQKTSIRQWIEQGALNN